METKYLERFKKVDSNTLPLRGNRLLVEVLPKEDIKVGGLFVASDMRDHRSSTEQNRADLAVVLAVGAGYIDEDGKDIAIDLKPGNIVLLSRMGLKFYSQFPGIPDYTAETLALTRETEVHCAWESAEHYEQYKKSLNG